MRQCFINDVVGIYLRPASITVALITACQSDSRQQSTSQQSRRCLIHINSSGLSLENFSTTFKDTDTLERLKLTTNEGADKQSVSNPAVWKGPLKSFWFIIAGTGRVCSCCIQAWAPLNVNTVIFPGDKWRHTTHFWEHCAYQYGFLTKKASLIWFSAAQSLWNKKRLH